MANKQMHRITGEEMINNIRTKIIQVITTFTKTIKIHTQNKQNIVTVSQ